MVIISVVNECLNVKSRVFEIIGKLDAAIDNLRYSKDCMEGQVDIGGKVPQVDLIDSNINSLKELKEQINNLNGACDTIIECENTKIRNSKIEENGVEKVAIKPLLKMNGFEVMKE